MNIRYPAQNAQNYALDIYWVPCQSKNGGQRGYPKGTIQTAGNPPLGAIDAYYDDLFDCHSTDHHILDYSHILQLDMPDVLQGQYSNS